MTRQFYMRIFTRCTLASSILLCALAASAQEISYDCVMEPRSTIELGSADEGILADLLIERGDIVKKGQPVALLNDEEERLQVERARIRAEADVDVRSKRAEAEFRLREEERIADLYATKLLPEKEYAQAKIERAGQDRKKTGRARCAVCRDRVPGCQGRLPAGTGKTGSALY